MKQTVLESIRAARRVSTPVLAISTSDQQAFVESLRELTKAPRAQWDIVQGFTPLNEAGQSALGVFRDTKILQPDAALAAAVELPENTILVIRNAHKYLVSAAVLQAVQILRDAYKVSHRTLILLAPIARMPIELQSDVVTFDDPLPADEQLEKIVRDIHRDAKETTPDLPDLTDEAVARAVNACRGLPAFTAEQVVSMSMTKDGLDEDEVWARKASAINQTDGLRFEKLKPSDLSGELRGNAQVLKFTRGLFEGNDPPDAVVLLDEIEKSMAGAFNPIGDSSGVSQDINGVLLREMEDNQHDGQVCYGPPGSGKTRYAQEIAARHGVPLIHCDLNAMKRGVVGETEAAVRNAMRVLRSIGKRLLFVMTCNKMTALPTELRRRCRAGLYFFDLPSEGEREEIWKVYLEAFNLDADMARPDDTDWTGAEIRNCVLFAYRLKTSLVEAAEYIVPVAKSSPEALKEARDAARGKFLSASYPGLYAGYAAEAAKGRLETKRRRRMDAAN